jgi:hypothetical protein
MSLPAPRWSSIPALIVGAALLGAAFPAAAAMRCGTHLISEGDTAGKLRRHCGEPADVDRRTAFRAPIIWRFGRPYQVPGGEIEVQIEFWTFNFGPNQLMRRVKLEDGRVTQIETLSHGYVER